MRGSHRVTWPPSLLAACATLVTGSTVPLAADPLRGRGLTRCLVWQGLSRPRVVVRGAPASRPGWLPFSCLSPFPARWEMSTPSPQEWSRVFANKIKAFHDFVSYPRRWVTCAQPLCLLSTCFPHAALASCGGPVNVQLPKVVRLPEGSIYTEVENALGINGCWLVSKGDKMPHRLKLRSASFNNVSALPEVLQGLRLGDVAPTLASWFFISGDIDR